MQDEFQDVDLCDDELRLEEVVFAEGDAGGEHGGAVGFEYFADLG